MSCSAIRSRALPTSRHFLERRVRRPLRDDVLDFILDFGTRSRASGMTHVTVLERELPVAWRDSSLARQARGWIVLLNDHERLVTCYRRGDASHFIRCKPKRRRGEAREQRA
ncbi:hypothetical protein ACLESO_54900 [Pyxidicoccus sp. 3LG]